MKGEVNDMKPDSLPSAQRAFWESTGAEIWILFIYVILNSSGYA
jgi:hypothetical protein